MAKLTDYLSPILLWSVLLPLWLAGIAAALWICFILVSARVYIVDAYLFSNTPTLERVANVTPWTTCDDANLSENQRYDRRSGAYDLGFHHVQFQQVRQHGSRYIELDQVSVRVEPRGGVIAASFLGGLAVLVGVTFGWIRFIRYLRKKWNRPPPLPT